MVFYFFKDIRNKKNIILGKFLDFPDFKPFLSQHSRSGNTFDLLKINDIGRGTSYLSFITKNKALPVLVLAI